MTEDYNKNLINYFTNKLVDTSPTTSEKYEEMKELPRSQWTSYMPSSWDSMRIEGVIKSNINDNVVLYGGYKKDSTIAGFVILADRNMKPFKYIDSFDSGTKLRYIQCMRQAEDGTFYFIDDTDYSPAEESTITTSEKRFVMVNNFATSLNNDYKINLRASYIFGNDYRNFYCRDMAKNPTTSHYAFIGKRFVVSGNRFLATSVIELKVNVGISNDWSILSTDEENAKQEYGGSYIEFNDDDQTFYRILVEYLADRGTYCVSKDFTQTTLTSTFIYNSPDYNDDGIDSRNLSNQCIFTNRNEVYYVSTNQRKSWNGSVENKHIALMYYNFSTNTTQTIFDKALGSAVSMNKELICLYVNQGYLYIAYMVDSDENGTADYYYQRYTGTWNPIQISTNKNYSITQRGLYVNNDYNIVQIYIYPTNLRSPSWYFPTIKEIFNPSQYNGESYVDTNFASPLYANLYSSGSLVFSRDLYNISKQNNMTTSSVEVPNNYLNGITIGKNNLISKTNFKIVEDTTNWAKNIYEVVDVNFLNIINIIDEDTNTEYMLGAIKVNNGITDGGTTNYNNTRCIKYRVNYEDNTTLVNTITWGDINDLVKQTYFTIYVDKAIKSIDLISNDESTIYLTINGNFEIENYYRINQKVRIGNKLQQENLVYNAQNVLYNGEQVKVYTY